MPATIKDPVQFPGTEALPELVQVLLRNFFPSDELPTPGMVAGKAGRGAKDLLAAIKSSKTAAAERMSKMGPMSSVGQGATMTLEGISPGTLAPLPHVIDSSKKAVPVVLEELAWEKGTPPGFLTAHPAVQEMVQMLRRVPEDRLEHKMAAATISRGVTGHRPPKPTLITAPDGFDFKQSSRSATRNIKGGTPTIQVSRGKFVKEMTEIYKNFDRAQRAARLAKWRYTDPYKYPIPQK